MNRGSRSSSYHSLRQPTSTNRHYSPERYQARYSSQRNSSEHYDKNRSSQQGSPERYVTHCKSHSSLNFSRSTECHSDKRRLKRNVEGMLYRKSLYRTFMYHTFIFGEDYVLGLVYRTSFFGMKCVWDYCTAHRFSG
ncbi:hypothetical protein HK096_005929 [Nowakowskiella sp. JEL0078]|nr:hypothetical protein HK096_005929 [Nowakowskiella sp. JEL0078]